MFFESNEQRERRILRNYQAEKGISFLSNKEQAAIYWEMRMGKTLVVVRFVKHETQYLPMLISGPYSVLSGWRNELRLEGVPNSEICLIDGTKANRKKMLNSSASFVLINKEGYMSVPEISRIRWGSVVLDESPFIKNPFSNITKFYCDNFNHVKRKIILSGTPAPESELDYYSQMQFLNPSILRFDDFYKFRNTLFGQGFQHNYILLEEGKAILSQRLATACNFLTRKDVGLQGKTIYMQRIIPLSKSLRKTYDRAEKEYVLTQNGQVLDVTDFDIASYTWLRKLCGGFIEEQFVFDAKIEELFSLMQGELKHKQLIVWCSYTNEIEKLVEVFTKKKITFSLVYGKVKHDKREEERLRFQRGESQIFLGNPKCFQYGTDLTAADAMIYYTSPLEGIVRRQADARMDNVLIKDSSLIIDFIVEHSIEEDIYVSHIRKETQEETMRRLVQGIFNRQGNSK